MNFRDEEILKKFGRHLSKIRKEKNFTQERLAYTSDITLSLIARIETGKINPTLCTLVKIVRTIDVTSSELLDFEF